jgi:putative FmdB family regulatory protein
MPIFEYKCNDCGNVMEVLEKTRGHFKYKCEKCNSSNLQKLLSNFAVGRSESTSPVCQACPGHIQSHNTCSSSECPYSI